MCPRCEALHVLGLGMEALENEIRSTYRLLAKAWQPESFQDDPKLQEAAETKLKDVQTAFDFLTLTSTDRGQARRPIYLSTKMAAAPAVPNAVSAAQMAHAGSVAPVSAPVSVAAASPAATSGEVPPEGTWQKIKFHHQKVMLVFNKIYRFYKRVKLILTITVVIFVLLSGGSIWRNSRMHHPANRQSGQNVGLLDKIEQEMRSLAPSSSAPAAGPQTGQPLPSNVKSRQQEKTHAAAHPAQPATNKLKPYLTVGSTRDEVMAQQGTPTASTEDKLVYGSSELYLKDGRVIGWRIDPFSSPIRVKLWPQTPVDPDLEFFTVNSTKDEVLVVQGTPTEFSEDMFKYGDSVVYFSNNRVVNWKNDAGSVPLRVR